MTAIVLPGQQGAADVFVAARGSAFRYIAQWRKYITWDGQRWNQDAGDALVRKLWQEHLRDVINVTLTGGSESPKEALKEAAKMSDAHYESAVLLLCQARTLADFRDFDADGYVLNCANGIVDLRSGVLRPHDPSAMCTRFAPVAWEPAAQCPKWLEYLRWAMQGDAERVAYLQRFFGLCLTGDAEHELAHFFWGEGGNGKTTVLKTIEMLLGDYATRAQAKLLMQRKHEPHPTELAALCGRRLVVLAETNENQTLDEQQLKVVASKDPISARRMREDFWTFAPTHKSVLLTNNRPRIRGQDDGVWRRIVLVEWGARVADVEKDPHFGDRFVPELPGILQWAHAGLLEVLRTGRLAAPTSIDATTREYRHAEDSVGRWLDARCSRDRSFVGAAGELYADYSKWADTNNETWLTSQAFGKRLAALGFESSKASGERAWRGLRLGRV